MIECVAAAGNILGESPIWDSRRQILWWVDIHALKLHSFTPSTGAHGISTLPEQVGSIGLRQNGGLVASTRLGFRFFDPAVGRMEPVTSPSDDPLAGRFDLRFNDGRCDRFGRFWAGTVQEKRVLGGAALYRLDADRRCHLMADGVTVSNGLSWSPDDRTMYFADSQAREIYAYDFDGPSGSLGARRVFARYRPDDGIPDGATVDAEGYLWSAGIGGGRLLRYAPDGRLDREIPMPVTQPTSCTFGGPDLATLYVTSATVRLTAEDKAKQPLAGALFALDVGVRGLDEPRYKG
ncbi:MAG: SMP-30/gluconolactonase/LRE family protein [Tagaea sp.]|nr:SMP-30/gluconolactonase/LRE family protein [Tagaea sp.]